MKFIALLVEQISRYVHGNLGVNRRRVLLHRFFLEDAHDVQRRGFNGADMAGAVATRAGDMAGFAQRSLQALARQFQQAEARDLAGLHAGTIVLERVAQAVFHITLVARGFHVDEIDDHQAAKVAQAQLACDFVRRFEVGAQCRFLDVGAAGGFCGVHVDRDHGFRMVDDDRATGWQGHLARVGRFNLVFDLEARKERNVVVVHLHAVDILRHHVAHELPGLIEDAFGVDQDFADFLMEVVADRANHQAAFLIDQVGAALLLGRGFDGTPQLHEVVQIPVQFLDRTADAGGAGDDAHALGDFELVDGVPQLVAFFALDPARHAAAAGIIGHQDQVASGETDERGEGGALGAAFVLVDLDDQFLAFAQGFLDGDSGGIGVGVAEKGPADFLERQETVTLIAVVHERRFEAGLDAGDDAFVDVTLALFFSCSFYVEVDELLPIYDRDAQLFCVGRVKQHALHFLFSRAHMPTGRTNLWQRPGYPGRLISFLSSVKSSSEGRRKIRACWFVSCTSC